MWKRLVQPRVLVAIAISAAALAVVFSLVNIGTVMDRITSMPVPTLGMVFALAVAYLSLKYGQFESLLEDLGEPRKRSLSLVAFSVGEVAVPIPAGIYAQNYVLSRFCCYDVARSAGATTAILIVELVVSLLLLLVLGIPAWWWLRPAIGILLFVAALFVVALLKLRALRELFDWALGRKLLQPVRAGLIEVVKGIEDLFKPHIMLRASIVATAYLLALAGGFWLVGRGTGASGLTFYQATTIYLFAIVATELLPISAQLGVVELGGVGAAQAWGYSHDQGLAMMLGIRFVWTASVWLVAGIVLLVFHDEFTGGRKERERIRQALRTTVRERVQGTRR